MSSVVWMTTLPASTDSPHSDVGAASDAGSTAAAAVPPSPPWLRLRPQCARAAALQAEPTRTSGGLPPSIGGYDSWEADVLGVVGALAAHAWPCSDVNTGRSDRSERKRYGAKWPPSPMPPTWSRRHPGSRGLPHAASADCSARALSSPPPPRPTPTVGAAGGGTPPASAALSLNICCCCSTAGKASAAEPMPGGRGTSAKASPRAAPAPSPAPPAVAVAWLGCAPGEPRASCCCAAPAGKRGLSASPMCSAYAFPRAEGDSAPSTVS
mmetsp:Transcript_44095/g.132196  ORF Transcript_44095/g.132196 Transcript_44095/m.132196 type:complete len:268 (-) Transcript_44095:478-1281(-)